MQRHYRHLYFYQFGLGDFSHTCTEEKGNMLLTYCQTDRASSQHSVASEMFGVDELVDMAALYFSAVKPLVQHYTSWALDDLAPETKDPQSSELLSKMEEE